jgi:hypothetical protein
LKGPVYETTQQRKKNGEFSKFDSAIDKLFRASKAEVDRAMEKEKRERERKRKAG